MMTNLPVKEAPKYEYTDYLRDKLMQINNHNVSCLFKATLAHHATKGLQDCDNEYDSYFCYSDQEPEARYVDWKPNNEVRDNPEDQPCNKSVESVPSHELSGSSELELSIEILRSQLYNIRIGRSPHNANMKGEEHSVVGSLCSTDEDLDQMRKPNLTDFYENLKIGPEERFPNNEICGWRVCRGGHLTDLDPILLQYHSENDIFSESTRKMMNRRPQCTVHVVTSGERVPFGVHPYLLQPDDRCLIEKFEKNSNQNATSKGQSKNIKSHPKTRTQKLRSKSAKNKSSGHCDIKSSIQQLIEAPIAYKFTHNRGYRSNYIQQYREQYTTKKLQHILLQCAEKYYASKQQQPVAKAAVQCTDVRDGACLVNDGAPKVTMKKQMQTKSLHGQKPLGFIRKKPNPLKVSQYKFDMAQKLRTYNMSRQDKTRPKSGSVESSPCVTPVERKKTESLGPFCLSLTGGPKLKSGLQQSSLQDVSSYQDLTKTAIESNEELSCETAETLLCEGTDKQSELEQAKTILTKILRGGSPIVSRSRPTIPSNSRGIVHATSVETPMHIVTGTKPLLQDKKRTDKLSKSTHFTDSPVTLTGQTEECINYPVCEVEPETSTEGFVSREQEITQSTADIYDVNDRLQMHRDDRSTIGSHVEQGLHTVSAPTVADVQPCSRERQHQLNLIKNEPDSDSAYGQGPILLLPKPQVPKVNRKKGTTNSNLVKNLGRIEHKTTFINKR